MRFQTRNAYYLRISATTILPLYLYLDERHVEWMSERVLQYVLADLRPLIIPKLNAEADAQLGPGGPANAKRGTLDVHRGDTYQFGYFLRGTEPHAVLIKARTFTAAPPRPPGSMLPPPVPSRAKKSAADAPKTSKKRKPKPRPKGKGKAKAVEDEDEAISISSEDEGAPDRNTPDSLAARRPKRARKVAAGGYRENEDEDFDNSQDDQQMEGSTNYEPMETEPVQDPTVIVPKREETEATIPDEPQEPHDVDDPKQPHTATMDVELVDDEEDVKPKPILKLRYHGFNIHGRCLCVIVEPYPPLRSASRAVSLAPMGVVAPRPSSIAPPDFAPTGGAGQRERTPLFLPDFDRDSTPAPSTMRSMPPVPSFSETTEGGSDDEDGGMVLFSQILRSVGDHPPGIAEDDDEIDGAVFFGDADEMREL